MQRMVWTLLCFAIIPCAFAQSLPPGFSNPQVALETYQKIAQQGGWSQIPPGPKLEPGMNDERIPLLRQRLLVTGELKKNKKQDEILFDPELESALRLFQKRQGIDEDGVVGKATLKALNIPIEKRLRQIQVNLERFQNFPSELESKYILVNIPDYRLDVIENNQRILTMKVVVGLPSWPTPLINGEIAYLVLNPRWHIPQNILQKETLGKIRENPNYIAQQNFKIFRKVGSERIEVDPTTINWTDENIAINDYHFQQEPGGFNPLGRVKFIFPNKYDVYLHDTTSKNFFRRPVRGLSHGCIRIEKPMELAEYVLKEEPKWTPENIQSAIKRGREMRVPLLTKMPIHIVYLTAWVDSEGVAQFRSDIYKLDK